MPLQIQSVIGLIVLRLFAWLLSERRSAAAWRPLLLGSLAQLALAALFLKLPFLTDVFGRLNDVVLGIERASEAGSTFVFGFLGGGPLPYTETLAGGSIIFAFRFLPLLIVV